MRSQSGSFVDPPFWQPLLLGAKPHQLETHTSNSPPGSRQVLRDSATPNQYTPATVPTQPHHEQPADAGPGLLTPKGYG